MRSVAWGRNTGIPYRKYAYGNLGKIYFVAVKPKKVYSEPKSVWYYLWVTGLVFDCKCCRNFSSIYPKYQVCWEKWHLTLSFTSVLFLLFLLQFVPPCPHSIFSFSSATLPLSNVFRYKLCIQNSLRKNFLKFLKFPKILLEVTIFSMT